MTYRRFFPVFQKIARSRAAVALALFLGALVGCDRPEIQEYTAKRIVNAPLAESGGPPVRLLGAVFPRDRTNWFFKLMGPADDVKQVQDEVAQFFGSVRFEGDEPPRYKVPESWKPGKGNQFSQAAFALGPDGKLELTVSSVKGSVLENINRWRRQIGLRPISADGLDRECKEIDAGGVKGKLVDLMGTKSGGGMPPFAAGAHKALPERGADEGQAGRPTFVVPAGWSEAPLRTFSVAAFRVGEAGKTAEVTVTPLAGAAGGLLENINRWRTEQLGLPPIAEEQLAQDLKPIQVDGSAGHFVDLKGDKGRILGAVVARGGQSWFFKMKGDADLVGKQKPAFEAFVQSVRFKGAGNEQ